MAWTKDMAKTAEEALLFSELSDEEEARFRQWAREHIGTKPDPLFHPVVNDELKKIANARSGLERN
jgi:hypothetical protein